MDVGRAIKAARLKAKLTQGQLAKRLNVVTSVVCEWELGRFNPAADRMPKIASVLKIEIEDLFA